MSGRDDDAWRQIVDNYGETPDFPEAPSEPAAKGPFGGAFDALDEPEDPPEWQEEEFVPPEPPPIPRPRGARLAAWLGLFGTPVLLVLSLLLGHRLSSFVTTGLVLWFLGGFLYLVWQMPKGPADPWDDGARL